MRSRAKKTSPPTLPKAPEQCFAWQGFALSIPESFAPTVLSGDADSGYACLDDGEGSLLHVRWLPGDDFDRLHRAVAKYLKTTAKRRGPARISGRGYRQGEMRGLWQVTGGRSFIMESNATRGNLLERAQSSLTVFAGRWRWSMLGLDVQMPEGARLDRRLLVSGRTRLEFKLPRFRGRLIAERWGMATLLLRQRHLADWAASALGWSVAATLDEVDRCILSKGREVALFVYQPEYDRIQLLVGPDRGLEWKPAWDWFGEAT